MTILFTDDVAKVDSQVTWISRATNRTVKAIARIPWIVGLFVVLFGGLLYLIITYPLIVFFRSQFVRIASSIQATLESTNGGPGMTELHMIIRQMINSTGVTIVATTGYYVLKPLRNEFIRINEAAKGVEKLLLPIAYPNHKSPLTSEQHRRLGSTFKDWKDDWADESMSVYDEEK